MSKVALFFVDLWKNRYLVWQLAKRDVTEQYKKSKLGMIWSVLEPLSFIGILYLVFGIGLKAGQTMSMPFLCYLVSGISVLNFFTETMNSGTLAIKNHSYILKKINFRLSILPVSTILTGVINHLIFLVVVVVTFVLYGVFPSVFWLQLIYYIFCLSTLLLGIVLLFSSIGVFMADLQHITAVISRMLFYFTPVFWSFDILPEKLKFIMKLNPLYYIVRGFRDSLYNGVWFWEYRGSGIFFWGLTIFILFIGSFSFRKLRPQFADFV